MQGEHILHQKKQTKVNKQKKSQTKEKLFMVFGTPPPPHPNKQTNKKTLVWLSSAKEQENELYIGIIFYGQVTWR